MSGLAVPSPEAMSTQKRIVAQERVFLHFFIPCHPVAFHIRRKRTARTAAKSSRKAVSALHTSRHFRFAAPLQGASVVRNAYRPPLSIYSTFARAGIRPCAMRHWQKSQQSEEKNHAFPPMLSCHATSLSGWAAPGSPATFSRPDQASCRKKKAQQALSEPGSAAVGRSMACTQGNGICRSCFCKSHFSRKAFLCPFFPSPRI